MSGAILRSQHHSAAALSQDDQRSSVRTLQQNIRWLVALDLAYDQRNGVVGL
jgi:hypothetical protein